MRPVRNNEQEHRDGGDACHDEGELSVMLPDCVGTIVDGDGPTPSTIGRSFFLWPMKGQREREEETRQLVGQRMTKQIGTYRNPTRLEIIPGPTGIVGEAGK